MQAASSGAHASSATLWPKLEPIQVPLQFGTNATGILLAGEITQVKEAIPWVRCASAELLGAQTATQNWSPTKKGRGSKKWKKRK